MQNVDQVVIPRPIMALKNKAPKSKRPAPSDLRRASRPLSELWQFLGVKDLSDISRVSRDEEEDQLDDIIDADEFTEEMEDLIDDEEEGDEDSNAPLTADLPDRAHKLLADRQPQIRALLDTVETYIAGDREQWVSVVSACSLQTSTIRLTPSLIGRAILKGSALGSRFDRQPSLIVKVS